MVVVGLNWQVLLLQLVILYTCLHIEPATIRLSPEEEFFFPFIVEKIPYTVRAYTLLHPNQYSRNLDSSQTPKPFKKIEWLNLLKA